MRPNVDVHNLLQMAKDHLWHDQYRFDNKSSPIIGIKGEGGWVTDIHGKKYFEGMSGHSCLNLGYGQTELVQAASEAMQNLSYLSPTACHLPAVALAAKLSELLQGPYVTTFSTSGSEANEIALKIARQYQILRGYPYKYKFICNYRGYHGSTAGALNASAQASFKIKFGSSLPGFIHVLPPYRYRFPFGENAPRSDLIMADLIDEVIRREEADTVAAVIVEPYLFAGGCIIPSAEYLTRVAEICRRHEVLLIVDEVITGFGRTGKMFGFQHSQGVEPDIVTMAKGLTSAYVPLGATAVRAPIYAAFRDNREHLRHFSTMGGVPVACAVAQKNIEIMEREHLVERVARLSQSILDDLHELVALPQVGEVRGIGFMYGIEFVEEKETKQPVAPAFVQRIAAACKTNGLLVGHDDSVIRINPPLTSTENDLRFLVKTLSAVIQDACR